MEHARNVLGEADASHAEYGDDGAQHGVHRGANRAALITPLACALQGVDMTVDLVPGTTLARLYGRGRATEHATCSFGLGPARQDIAGRAGMRVAAVDDRLEIRAVERTDHPFLVATLFQPQLRSRPGDPHPVFAGFIGAITQ